MKWTIVADSSIDMKSKDFVNDEIKFTIVPLRIIIEDKEYLDDDNVDINSMLVDMKNTKAAPTSACPAPETFAEAFRQADNVICICMTSGLSGTYNSACIARDMVKEQDPTKNICIIDTKATAGAMVLVARKAEKLIMDGADFETVSKTLESYAKTVRVTFSLACFDNLVKNGRMSAFTGLLASKLGIRAVATNSSEGKIEMIKKPRGEDKALEAMIEFMAETKDMTDMPVVISHCNNESGAHKLATLLKEKFTSNITILTCKALTTFYAMEKGLIVGF